MDWLQTVVLALVQGFTEFLPISSSGHLILVPKLIGWPDQGAAFDVALHVGSLVAVVAYFRLELQAMIRDGVLSIARRRHVGESPLAWAVVLGTIPVGLAALAFKDVIETELRSPLVIATTSIAFGLLLWLADVMGKRMAEPRPLNWQRILFIACAQALALIPGTSRSGITMTAGLMAGLGREESARFSFLLAIPTIILAGLLQTVELIQAEGTVDWGVLFAGTVMAAISAYACIHYFLKLIQQIGMLPFVIYRIALGLLLFWVFA